MKLPIINRPTLVMKLVTLLSVATLCGNSSPASVVLDSRGFESPTYVAGDLDGQNNWLNLGDGGGSAVVQTVVKQAGNQAVQVDRVAESDDWWLIPDLVGYPTGRRIVVEWDMYVVQSTGVQDYGPFFAVETYDDQSAGGSIGLLGALGVDAKTGDVLYRKSPDSALVETGTVVGFDQWNHYSIVLDYASDRYSGYLNDTLLVSTDFVDVDLGLDNFTDADIAALAAASDTASERAAATAYFDNFLVRERLTWDGSNSDWNAIVVGPPDYSHWSADSTDLPSPVLGAVVESGICTVPSGYAAEAHSVTVSGIGTLAVELGGSLTTTAEADFQLGGVLANQVQGPSASGQLAAGGQLSIAEADAIQVDWLPGSDAASMFGGVYTIAEYTGDALTTTGTTTNADANIGVGYIKSVDYDVDVNSDGTLWAVDITLRPQGLGDTDLDADVDGDDLATFGLAWSPSGTDKTWFDGDFDFDGDIDGDDLAALGLAWAPGGISFPAGDIEVTSVPEPGTAILLLLAAAGLLIYRKRR